MPKNQTWTVWLLGLVMVVGCGGDPLDRATVNGKVTIDGKPIPQGEIRFVPIDFGKDLPAAGAQIENGTYRVENKGGVPAGEFRVEIQMFQAQIGSTDMTGVIRQVLPDKFNKKSTLTLTVPPGGKSLTKNYDLKW